MDELSRYFPPGVKYDIPYDSSRFVSISISRGGQDAGRGDGAGVPGDVPVPAELALHADPDHRGAGRAAGHLRACCWRSASRSTC